MAGYVEAFGAYLLQAHAWVAVILPAAVCLWLARRVPTSRGWPALQVWCLSVAASYVTAQWDFDQDLASFFIQPWALYIYAAMLYQRLQVSPAEMVVVTFTSLLTVDLMGATHLALGGYTRATEFYHGVGGAGLRDGLLMFPFFALLVYAYIALRRGQPVRLG